MRFLWTCPKEKQDEFRDVQGYRKDCADRIEKNNLYTNLLRREEQLRQLAPAEVPQVGAFPVAAIAVGAVRVGMAARSAYQIYATIRDIINDPLVQKSWEEGHYRDAFGYSMPHVPGVGDAIHAKHAWYLRDYKGALLHGGSAGITFFGTFSGIKDGVKGGKWIVKKGLPKFRNLRVEKWWSKQGGIPKTGPSVKIKPFSTPEQVAKATKKAETVFGKEVKKITPRQRLDGKGGACQIEFKDGTKIDINPDRVKMDVPTPRNPRSAMGKHDFVKKGNLPEGSKVVVKEGKILPHKRTLTEAEMKLLEDLIE